MAKKSGSPLDDISVVIPYPRLCELLKASEELVQLRKDNERLEEQVTALRMIQGECMEKIKDLERYL